MKPSLSSSKTTPQLVPVGPSSPGSEMQGMFVFWQNSGTLWLVLDFALKYLKSNFLWCMLVIIITQVGSYFSPWKVADFFLERILIALHVR